MASLKVLNLQGEEVGKVNLDKEVFGIEPNKQVIYDAIQVYRSNSRQATSKTKKRDEVSGGGRKPWRQKGTGRARQGSIRSPQWKGGGVVFGPTGEQNFKIKQNKKERVLALKSALSIKAQDKKIHAVEKCELEERKTKKVIEMLTTLKLEGKTLIVIGLESANEEFYDSTLNVPTVNVVFFDELNVYDILNSDQLLFTKEAIESLSEVLNG